MQDSEAVCQRSAAEGWAVLRHGIALDQKFGRWAEQRPATHAVYEFIRFGIKQAWACLFGGLMLALLIGTYFFYPRAASLHRYDFLTISAVVIQIVLLKTRLETLDEAKVIALFHVVGTAMEIFKTSVGSWVYPEEAVLRIGGVPLFTGFMYAAVGSFIMRCWALFDFRFTRHPPLWSLGLLSLAIYVNFFTHHYTADIRVALFLGAGLLFGPTLIHYKIWKVHRTMPLLVAALLTALFIWVAENIGTASAAWAYPNQKRGWQLVPIGKLGAWFLLMIISYTMVAAFNGIRKRDAT